MTLHVYAPWFMLCSICTVLHHVFISEAGASIFAIVFNLSEAYAATQQDQQKQVGTGISLLSDLTPTPQMLGIPVSTGVFSFRLCVRRPTTRTSTWLRSSSGTAQSRPMPAVRSAKPFMIGTHADELAKAVGSESWREPFTVKMWQALYKIEVMLRRASLQGAGWEAAFVLDVSGARGPQSSSASSPGARRRIPLASKRQLSLQSESHLPWLTSIRLPGSLH